MPARLHLNKKPAFLLVSVNFEEKWKTVLLTAEKYLVRLLVVESEKVIANIESETESNLKKEDPFNFKTHYKYRSYLKQKA